MMKYLMLTIFSCITSIAFGQEITNKGKLYVNWGWNRAAYSNSDINFKGSDYNFMLYNVKAKDRQTSFSVDAYLNPTKITIPQTNYGFGYFIDENHSIYVGVDHMKYVMTQDQTVEINGQIGVSHMPYTGLYANGDQKILDENFLTFEHTDGLNYINILFNRYDDIGKHIGLKPQLYKLSVTEGLGAGLMLPKTNAKLMGNERHDDFHVSGFGISAQVGLNLVFLKYFFVQADVRGGYINMPDIRTTKFQEDRASQQLFYAQTALLFGGRFSLL